MERVGLVALATVMISERAGTAAGAYGEWPGRERSSAKRAGRRTATAGWTRRGGRVPAALWALALAAMLLAGGGDLASAQAQSADGCYSGDGGAYYFYFDAATWYVLVDDGAGGTSWATWGQFRAATGVADPTIAPVACQVGSYIHEGVRYYLDQTSTWYIETDSGWMSLADYAARIEASQAAGAVLAAEMSARDHVAIGRTLAPACVDSLYGYP